MVRVLHPVVAIRCLKQLAEDNFDQFPQSTKVIMNDFYVDNLLIGSNDLNELNKTCKEVYNILGSAQFILRKWISNNSQVLAGLPFSNISNSTLKLGQNESCKTLGIEWVTHLDILKYKSLECNINTQLITKRSILSTIAQIFDPLGLLSPIIIVSKLLIQHLWIERLPWDSKIPPHLEKQFLQFKMSLIKLNQIEIPRNTIPKNYKLIDVHCFCDSSKDAYAAAIYLRSKDENDNFQVHLLCAKSKVAPLKTISIPKLELCAGLLGAQLMELVKKSMNIDVPIIYWSDSQIVLNWIHTEPSKLQVFVSNRVSKIQSLTDIFNWRYISTKENPADLATRGITTHQLISSIWWSGPSFLKTFESNWPNIDYFLSFKELPELRKNVAVLSTVTKDYNYLFTRFSCLNKLKRITAFCIRFYTNINCKLNKTAIITGPLSVFELTTAHYTLIRIAQSETFEKEILTLKKGISLNKNDRLSPLTPFVDEKGILRVGGRLKHTDLPFDSKHPILLCSRHPLTKLIFEYKHKVLLHPGTQLLLSSVRQYYWVIRGKDLSKAVVRNCLTCFKFKPQHFTSPMAALPNNRVKPSFPFATTGIDYAGPFFVLSKPGRGAKLTKCYLAVFVCFCTKAVHLELVSNLTTECFLACLRRFMARRGIPHTIYSDNGSTFIGARNELKDLGHFISKVKASIVDSTSSENIKWVFIPPYTGGIITGGFGKQL